MLHSSAFMNSSCSKYFVLFVFSFRRKRVIATCGCAQTNCNTVSRNDRKERKKADDTKETEQLKIYYS